MSDRSRSSPAWWTPSAHADRRPFLIGRNRIQAAFRSHVQAQYVGSEFAKAWPEGVLDQINALGD